MLGACGGRTIESLLVHDVWNIWVIGIRYRSVKYVEAKAASTNLSHKLVWSFKLWKILVSQNILNYFLTPHFYPTLQAPGLKN